MAKHEPDLRHSADQILQGIRIVLPGTQALMGFQFIAFFSETFHNLPAHLKNLHFAALVLIILCSILLIAPVAYQQIGEDGNITDRFLRFARRMLASAMLFLITALACDVYLAAEVIDISNGLALGLAALLFSIACFLWYGFSFIDKSYKNT